MKQRLSRSRRASISATLDTARTRLLEATAKCAILERLPDPRTLASLSASLSSASDLLTEIAGQLDPTYQPD